MKSKAEDFFFDVRLGDPPGFYEFFDRLHVKKSTAAFFFLPPESFSCF